VVNIGVMRNVAMCSLALLLGTAGTGCDLLSPCTNREKFVDLIYDDLLYDKRRAWMEHDIAHSGWDCLEHETIRNALGSDIGTRYRCTVCN
jgi:hypothetical protein